MEFYPQSATRTLGFEAVRARLESAARSEAGKQLARTLAPAASFGEAVAELNRVSAVQALYSGGEAVPSTDFDPVGDYVRMAQPVGSYLEPDALARIRGLIRCADRLRSFFQSRAADLPVLSEIASWLVPLPWLADSIDDVIDSQGEIHDHASPELRRIRREKIDTREHLRSAVQRALRNASGQGWATEDQPTIRGGRMVIPVRAEAKRKVDGIVHDVSASGQTAFIEPAACVSLNNDLRSLDAEERREIVRLLSRLTDGVRGASPDLLSNERATGIIDLIAAKARWAVRVDGVVPARGREGIIELNGARNPELEDRLGRKSVVPLDLSLGRDFRILVISGPNAGGKSVALKTVGLFALLLGCGLPIPADEGARFDAFDALLVDIGDDQSVEDDLSTFSSHLANWNRMLRQSDESSLVLIDEAGTGTDPDEGSALAQAALEGLLARGARAVVTTHHGPLKRFAHATDGVSNAMMRFDQAALSPTYRYEEGVPGASYAFEIADRMGLNPEVTARARELVGTERVTFERLLSELQSRNSDLEEVILAARSSAEEAEKRRAAMEERLAKLRDVRGEIREQALDQAADLIGNANAAIERAVREIREAQASREATLSARAAIDEVRKKVERDRARAGRKRQHRPASRAAALPQVAPMLEVGDQVVLDGGQHAGEILEIKDQEAVISLGPARLRVQITRLTKVGGKRKQKITVRQAASEPGTLPGSRAAHRVDLRGKRVDEAVASVMRVVDEGIAAGLGRVEVLHGKGTGALRAAIHEYLADRRDIAGFEEAPVEQGGAGVTIVRL